MMVRKVGRRRDMGWASQYIARLKEGEKFNLRSFHEYVWKNGNVPLALQRWELLGAPEDVPPLP